MQKRDAIWKHPSLQSVIPGKLLFRQEFLQQIDRARIMRLSQPEQRLLSDLRILVGPRDRDECWNSFVPRALGQREHCLLSHLAVDAIVEHEVLQVRSRG